MITLQREFFLTHNGEYGFSDIYEKKLLNWKLLNFEIDVDFITAEYFEIAKYLNYQIWEESNKIKIAAKYLNHIRMIEFPKGLISKLSLAIYEKAKEESKLRLLIADNNLRGTLVEGRINEYNEKNFEMRIWACRRMQPERYLEGKYPKAGPQKRVSLMYARKDRDIPNKEWEEFG